MHGVSDQTVIFGDLAMPSNGLESGDSVRLTSTQAAINWQEARRPPGHWKERWEPELDKDLARPCEVAKGRRKRKRDRKPHVGREKKRTSTAKARQGPS